MSQERAGANGPEPLEKMPTRIPGLDEILEGGLPAGRTSLLSGGPGSGKSIIGLEFLYRGALAGRPGVYVTFEESGEQIRRNAATLGWDLRALEESGTLYLIDAQIDPGAATSGEFNLGGMLAILDAKTRETGADRIVIDALDGLMRFFSDPLQQQNQLLVLHRWLMGRGLTSLLTVKAYNGSGIPSRHDFLDFLADCVLVLDQEIKGRVATKVLRVVKYRGSAYGGNAYPFLVTGEGLCFHPITDVLMNYGTPGRMITSGNAELDAVLGGGLQHGASVLISGQPGTGKTALASTFARAACIEGMKVLYVDYEESRESMLSGMRSLGIRLEPALAASELEILALMPESMGAEEHLHLILRTIERFRPDHVVVDAISACHRIAGQAAAFDFLLRLNSFCRDRGITVLLINQARARFSSDHEFSGIGLSSIIDTILTLHFRDMGDEVRRFLLVLKSRGKRHSNRYHPFFLTDRGIAVER